jgi:hypothetical protein
MIDEDRSIVHVAVIDSGVNVPHPHLPSVADGIALDAEGGASGDVVDRLGHGTAAAAAIHEKAPDALLHVVKVFDRELATTVTTLVRAIDWATERGCRLVNLSLGTPNAFRATELAPAIERAVARGAIIVSACATDGRRWYPGSMGGVVGVVMDPDQPRDAVDVIEYEGMEVLRAAPWPRPVPGLPRERNLHGISFAVANASGVLANLLARAPEVRTARAARALLRARASSPPVGH